MTSEIAVMNRQAIALAADSAVTFAGGQNQKIFPSANKIFTLSKYQPVGVMVYGNADFMEIPWETIIKIFRSRLGTDSFKTVGSYASHFLDFLRQGDLLFSDSKVEQRAYVDGSIRWCLGGIKEQHSFRAAVALIEEGRIDEEFSEDLITQIIQREFDEWYRADTAPNAPANFRSEFFEGYSDIIEQAMDEIMGGIPLAETSRKHLMDILVNLFLRFPTHVHIPASSGVVFAGFGTDDVFPVLEAYTVEGRIGDYLKYRRDEENCARIGGTDGAVVRPFAQREMVDTFMAGIDPEYRQRIDDLLDSLGRFGNEIPLDYIADFCSANHEDEDSEWFDPDFEYELRESIEPYWTEIIEAIEFKVESRLDEFQKSFSNYGQERHISPILSVVQGLPKDELAAMAESLINLTSFKRRVSMQAETVGGPIDVAVISKGDGFVWIKRKNYFEGDANPQFFANYFR